jgi:hypothetical protein
MRVMHSTCYLRRGIVYIPTLGMIDKGLYRDIEPVAVIPSSNSAALQQALSRTFANGNPRVPLPKQPDTSPSVLLKYVGVKTWRAFARDTSTWSVDERDGKYKILGYRKDPPNGWTHDKSLDEIFPAGTSAEKVISRMIAILQEAARERAG